VLLEGLHLRGVEHSFCGRVKLLQSNGIYVRRPVTASQPGSQWIAVVTAGFVVHIPSGAVDAVDANQVMDSIVLDKVSRGSNSHDVLVDNVLALPLLQLLLHLSDLPVVVQPPEVEHRFGIVLGHGALAGDDLGHKLLVVLALCGVVVELDGAIFGCAQVKLLCGDRALAICNGMA